MAAVLTVLFILHFNSFAFRATAADFHHLCQTASKAQTWEPSLAESYQRKDIVDGEHHPARVVVLTFGH